jgi:hypothetical protein
MGLGEFADWKNASEPRAEGQAEQVDNPYCVENIETLGTCQVNFIFMTMNAKVKDQSSKLWIFRGMTTRTKSDKNSSPQKLQSKEFGGEHELLIKISA